MEASAIPFSSNDKESMKRKLYGTLSIGISGFAALVIVTIVVVVIISIVAGGYQKFTWEFLTQEPTEGMTKGGIYPAIIGTVFMTLLMSIMAVPLGTITAIYLSEYPPAACISLWAISPSG